MSASEAELFEHFRAAAEKAGMTLSEGYPEQGGYWLAYGIHTTPLPDLKAVNRALVTGCGLHTLYPGRLRLVMVKTPEPAPASELVAEVAAPKPAVVQSEQPPQRPRNVAELQKMLDRRRVERLSSDEWWRKDSTPQNMKKRVTR